MGIPISIWLILASYFDIINYPKSIVTKKIDLRRNPNVNLFEKTGVISAEEITSFISQIESKL